MRVPNTFEDGEGDVDYCRGEFPKQVLIRGTILNADGAGISQCFKSHPFPS
jgi:hypothetical protein